MASKDSRLTPNQRTLRARIAAAESWARTEDWPARTAAARASSPASLDYWAAKIDPDGKLPPEDRAKRAEQARSAHYGRLAFKASKARRAKAAS